MNTTNDPDPDDPTDAADIASTLTDLRGVPLARLAAEDTDTGAAGIATARVLDLESHGLLAVASFNASI